MWISVYLVVSTQIDQHDHFVASIRVGFESEDDAVVILHRAGPQSLELTAQLVRFQGRVKRIVRQLVECLEDPFLTSETVAGVSPEGSTEAGPKPVWSWFAQEITSEILDGTILGAAVMNCL